MANCFGDFCGYRHCRCDTPGSVAHTLTARTVERKPVSFLVIGQNRYGHDEDLAQAKKNFRKYGGRLSDGYMIYEFTDGREFSGVDQMGGIHWTGNTDQIENEHITEVAPRKKAAAR